MKLTFVISFLFICIFCVKGFGQVTLNEKNASLEDVLKKIRNQTGYTYIFDADLMQSSALVSVSLKNVSLNDALKTIFKQQNLDYKLVDKNIVILKRKSAEPTERASENKTLSQITLKGKITDENNIPLNNIQVQELASQVKTISNAAGEFILKAPDRGRLAFTGKGFGEQVVDYVDTATSIVIKMQTQGIALSEVKIKLDEQKNEPTRFINMENRGYMNLSQILQGTVPGLSLQVGNVTTKEITSIDVFVPYRNGNQQLQQFVKMSVEEFYAYVGREKGQQIIDQLSSGRFVPSSISTYYRLNTTSRVTSTLLPQVRGANNFSASASGMLVVIDGFPQDGFPANYPMVNVESVEVIKDPRELIKWGPRANGGLILIRTKAAKKGSVQVNYTTNLYFQSAPEFNREKLRLASTSDYLGYIKDVDSLYKTEYTNNSLNFTPARRLFSQRRLGLITPANYTRSLDSLKALDNQEQIKLLQQDRFSQSHTLGLNGGTTTYRFNLLGNYSTDKGNDIKSYSRSGSINLNNEIHLFKDKLLINWLINYSNETSRSGYSFSPQSSLTEPYQMLLDAQGNYVYDYTNFSPYANSTILSAGYFNNGVNLLEDALVNKNLRRLIQKKSNLNFRWNLLPGLSWASSVYYNGTVNKTNNVYGQQSSYVRQLVNSYGQYSATGVNFYVPYGDILQPGNSKGDETNVRTSLSYGRTFGKHGVNLSLGAGGASVSSTRPNASRIYGYNSATGTGSPVFLPTPNQNSGIVNYYTLLPNSSYSPVYPFTLTTPINGDTVLSRNLNVNALMVYKFADRITVSGNYNNVYNPLYGQTAKYSTSNNYGADLTGLVFKKVGKVLQNVFISTGVQGLKMPDLPEVYNNLRYQQTAFGNYAIWVNGLEPTQQRGQSSRTIYQKLTVTLLDSMFSANVAYNSQKRKGNLSTLSTDAESLSNSLNGTDVSRFLSAGLSAQLRKGLLLFKLNYSKSPEGQSQVNGSGSYDIAHEKYFHSSVISALDFGFRIENISPYQGLGLMMGTNLASNGSFSQATNSSFNLLPPNNKNYEINGRMSLHDDAYSIDVRYYNQTSSGLNNYSSALTDPSTGLNARVTYSSITNSGVELFLKSRVAKSDAFQYDITLNGAYNRNVANKVPTPIFYGSSSYSREYRDGYDVSNIWSVKSAGLNNQGNPQIYDANGNITSKLDSATVAGSIVYSGVTRAPWTGGLIHDIRYKQFFSRIALVFNLGHVMRNYIPYLGNNNETSILIKDRWQKPGDEAFTDVPRLTNDASNTNYKAFVVQNGTNGIISADNIRLQEIMVGCNVAQPLMKRIGLSSCTIALTVQNVAFWASNKYNLDPVTVDMSGRPGMPVTRQYSCNINISF